MLEKQLFPLLPHSWDRVQCRGEQFPTMQIMVMGDGKAVSLISHSLKKVQDIGRMREKVGILPAGNIDLLIKPPPPRASVCLTFLCKRDHRQSMGYIHLFQEIVNTVQLTLSSIQHEQIKG
jgi:hypothetical protein